MTSQAQLRVCNYPTKCKILQFFVQWTICASLFVSPLSSKTTLHTFWGDQALKPGALKEPASTLGNSLSSEQGWKERKKSKLKKTKQRFALHRDGQDHNTWTGLKIYAGLAGLRPVIIIASGPVSSWLGKCVSLVFLLTFNLINLFQFCRVLKNSNYP